MNTLQASFDKFRYGIFEMVLLLLKLASIVLAFVQAEAEFIYSNFFTLVFF